jgi:hypothetical protein
MPRPDPVPPPSQDRLWTAEELADRYHVSLLTLRQWRWRRTGPKPIKVGRQPLYPESEIARYERDLAAR